MGRDEAGNSEVISPKMSHFTEKRRRGKLEASGHRLPRLDRAWTYLRSIDAWVLDRQMELTAIPAPSFGEEARGRRMAELFVEAGLRDVRTDDVGNVLGCLCTDDNSKSEKASAERPLILSAHLDTVFPPGTDVTPRREGDRIEAPGICDDGRGLAALLAVARVLKEVHSPLPFPLLFVATVGEEGPGDLRGVRHLLDKTVEGSGPAGFISLDGIGLDRVINRGVGSTRLRITLRGPGGHSWTDFGLPNPIHALGRIVAQAQALRLPLDPKTTLTVSRWGGGTSINSIPQEAWVEVDLRSEDGPHLEALEGSLMRILEGEIGERNRLGGDPSQLRLEVREIGRRPAGFTDPSDPLVKAALEATRILRVEPKLISSSTDANIPMSMGIPAITLGGGGEGGGIHTLEEWYENRKGPEGILRALLTLVLIGQGA
jgi:acetylornithine deacetylase/succinyl-diaminopimelate desuccinylase-like protein